MPVELTIFILSAMVFIYGVYLWRKGYYLILNGEKTEAMVYKNVSDSQVYYPVIRFKTKEGILIEHKMKFGRKPPISVGTIYKIIYDPTNPYNLQINSPFMLEILPRLLVSIGLFSSVIAYLEYLEVLDWF